MFYKIENNRVINSSNINLDWTYIELDLSEEEIDLLNKWYDYIDWQVVKWDNAIQFELNEIENKKTSLLKEIWELKQIKDWMELVWDDITEITAKINDLISEYKSL